MVDSAIAIGAFASGEMLYVGTVPNQSDESFFALTGFVIILVPAIAFLCGFYKLVLRFGSPTLIVRAAVVSTVSGFILTSARWYDGTGLGHALGSSFVFALVLFVGLLSSRASARTLLTRKERGKHRASIAIYGAGSAGQQLVAMLRRAAEFNPVAFLDDAPRLHGRTVEGLPVLAPNDPLVLERLEEKSVQQICLAIPSLMPQRRHEILDLLSTLPFSVRSVPGLIEIISGSALLDTLAKISIEDLLGRDLVPPIDGLLEKCVRGKGVLITGGGGSIGSELCRQVIARGPKFLVVLDHSEFALYQIEQELIALLRSMNVKTPISFQLGSVVDAPRMRKIFSEFEIDTVYHAAAYKHVPIVETNPFEGLRNNVLGTWNVAHIAATANVSHFVLISTDKAVRPTNVMGATKRMAELVVQSMAEQFSQCVFSMVRFGNVLDSSGSVVPLFRKQIEAGGPITLTHLEVTRYFMTISEAVQLTIQAGAMAQGGDVFVLDMGGAVKIRDLAIRMIHLSGLTLRDNDHLNGDIAIEVIGLRPGEKLYEELLISGDVLSTEHPRIMRSHEEKADWAELESDLKDFEKRIQDNSVGTSLGPVLERWVTGYKMPASAGSAL